MEKRLGPYEAFKEPIKPKEREVEPLELNQVGWKEYRERKQSHYKDKNREKSELKQRQEIETKELQQRHQEQRDKLLEKSWQGEGTLLNAMRKTLAGEQAAEKAALKESQKEEMESVRKKFGAYPEYQGLEIEEEQFVLGDNYKKPIPKLIIGYESKIKDGYVYYFTQKEPYKVAFIDKGNKIQVIDWRNEEVSLAALQLASKKSNGINVRGCEEFKEITVKLAAKYGYRVRNPELQERIRHEREKIDQQKDLRLEEQREGAEKGQKGKKDEDLEKLVLPPKDIKGMRM
jgi:hypothetical protein